MKKSNTPLIILTTVGLVGFLYFSFGNQITPDQIEACQKEAMERYGEVDELDFMERCQTDVGFVAMMETDENASAEEYAQNISSVNKRDIQLNFFGSFFLGLAIVGLVSLAAIHFGKKKKVKKGETESKK